MRVFHFALRACAPVLMLGSTAFGFSVTGAVRDQASLPVSGVNIDFIDTATGNNLPLTGDTTDATGAFTVDVPAGTYRITYTPEATSSLAAGEQPSVTVSADGVVPTMTLPPGYKLTLQTVTLAGAPVAGIKVNVTDGTASPVFTPRNTSSGSGLIQTVVPQAGAPYTLDLVDVGANGYADKELVGFSPAADTDLGPVVVGPARPVTGRTVRYSNGTVVSSVNVDIVDSCGLELRLRDDLSDSAGGFSLAGVSDGRYNITFRPPSATGLARREFRRVSIGAALSFGDVKLGTMHSLTGSIVNSSGSPISGIDLNLTEEAYGMQVELNNDNSDSAGSFLVQTSDGSYQVDFRPPSTTPYAPKTVFGVSLTADVNMGTVVLPNAVILSGTVRDPSNNVVEGADLNVIDRTAAKPVFTPNDKSDGSGSYAARLAPGTWDFVFTPPANRPDLLPRTFSAESIGANRILDVTLTSASSAVGDWQIYE